MTEPRALPLAEIVTRLDADARLAGTLVAEASEILRPSVAADLAVMKAQIELRDRIVARHGELLVTAAAIAADFALVRLGLMP